MSKAALGRGLKALIPSMDEDNDNGVQINSDNIKKDNGGINVIAKIEISRIDRNPFQPRINFNTDALSELKNSIIEKGVIQPITVRRKGSDRYELISGERRIRASIEAGMRLIPAYIIEVATNEEMLELAIIENIQREFLDPIETAQAYQRLADEYRYTHEEIAKKVSKDRTSVSNLIRLLKLPEKIQTSISKNEISMGHAKALITLPNLQTQLEVFNRIVKKGLSVRATETLAQSFSQSRKSKKAKKEDSKFIADLSYDNVTSQIRGILSTKVQIEKSKERDGGRIYIEYYSDDDLSRLLELFETIQK
jgi:ParB family transcriptional regulator, chromosome partitioning protein